jgi:hypothetical protein
LDQQFIVPVPATDSRWWDRHLGGGEECRAIPSSADSSRGRILDIWLTCHCWSGKIQRVYPWDYAEGVGGVSTAGRKHAKGPSGRPASGLSRMQTCGLSMDQMILCHHHEEKESWYYSILHTGIEPRLLWKHRRESWWDYWTVHGGTGTMHGTSVWLLLWDNSSLLVEGWQDAVRQCIGWCSSWTRIERTAEARTPRLQAATRAFGLCMFGNGEIVSCERGSRRRLLVSGLEEGFERALRESRLLRLPYCVEQGVDNVLLSGYKIHRAFLHCTVERRHQLTGATSHRRTQPWPAASCSSHIPSWTSDEPVVAWMDQ